MFLKIMVFCYVGRDSAVGIATRYGLDGPGIDSLWRAKFSAPIQTGPGAHPAACTMGTGSFPGVKRQGRGADHPPPSKCRGQESRAIPLLPLWAFVACYGSTYGLLSYDSVLIRDLLLTFQRFVFIFLWLHLRWGMRHVHHKLPINISLYPRRLVFMRSAVKVTYHKSCCNVSCFVSVRNIY